jgi:hypothetical protein
LLGSAWDDRNFRRTSPEAAVGFAPFRFGPREAEKAAKRKPSFAKRNERFRDTGRKSLISLWREIGYFAGLFVFNDLTAFSLRAVARSRHASGRAARHEKGEPGLADKF